MFGIDAVKQGLIFLSCILSPDLWTRIHARQRSCSVTFCSRALSIRKAECRSQSGLTLRKCRQPAASSGPQTQVDWPKQHE